MNDQYQRDDSQALFVFLIDPDYQGLFVIDDEFFQAPFDNESVLMNDQLF